MKCLHISKSNSLIYIPSSQSSSFSFVFNLVLLYTDITGTILPSKQVSEGAFPSKPISEGTLPVKQVSEDESLLVFSSETGNTVTCQLVDKLIQRVSDFEHSLHLQQEQLDSNVKEVQDIKNDLKSLSQTVLTGPEIAEEKLQSLVKLIEQKFDRYQSSISETQMSKSYFEEHYAGVISSNHTEISEIKDAIKLLQEQRLDDASNTRIPPDGISNPFESLRSKLDQLVDSLVPKEVSVNRQTHQREVRRERKSSIRKKGHSKSDVFQSPETISGMQRSFSLSSTSSATSGYKSIIHQDSDEQSTQPDLPPIGEASTIPLDFTPGATNSPMTPHRPTSTPGPENSEEAPDKTHIIIEVAWAMGDLLELLITLSGQNKATLEDEK